MALRRTEFCTEYAVRLVTRRHSGAWTDADEAALRAWLEAAPENRDAYAKVERVWSVAGHVSRVHSSARPARAFATRQLRAAAAALVLVAALIPLWRATIRWWSGTPYTSVAERGRARELTLNDGTQVVLDGGSEIVAEIGARSRRIALLRGEARFTVVHDASRPFHVEAGVGYVTDLGTRFDVEILPTAVNVSVLEGRVGLNTPVGEVQLSSGTTAGYDPAGALLPVRRIDLSSADWSHGSRHFDAEPLADIMERFARHRSLQVEFADPKSRELRISGTFRMDDLPVFLRTLTAAFPVEVRWTGPNRIEFFTRPEPARASPHPQT